MKVAVYLLLFAVVVCTAEENPILSDDFINEINNKQSLWKAGRNFDPNTPMSQLRGLFGVNKNKKFNKINVKTVYHNINKDDIPEQFDSRDTWANCASIKQIADQSACGSCWAVSTASAISDRICIASSGSSQPLVSASNIMACCEYCGDGCEGGYPIYAWNYWVKEGVVTGGPYNSTDGCQNYPFPSCEHHTTGSRPACQSDMYQTPSCTKTCDADSSKSYEDSLTYGSDHYLVGENEEQIQAEILKYGPVVADFIVYSDFLSYKSGIYQQTSGQAEGGHAVRILGWGVENDVKYWIIANSWNNDWGDNGIFKMIRGYDDCGIEDEVSAGLAKL